MRSEFEAWAMSVMNPNLDRYGDGQYRAPHIDIAWSAWQAATKAASEVCMEWRAGCDNRSIPEGWLLVPIEPNAVMVDAGDAEIDPGYCEESSSSRFVEDGESIAIYKAMLAAAPEYKP